MRHARHRSIAKVLGDALDRMQAQRARTLLRGRRIDTHGRRLTLMDLARSWPGAERIRAHSRRLIELIDQLRHPVRRYWISWVCRHEFVGHLRIRPGLKVRPIAHLP